LKWISPGPHAALALSIAASFWAKARQERSITARQVFMGVPLDGQRNCELTGPVTSVILSQVLFRKMQEARQP
jgi:hypothetical protein